MTDYTGTGRRDEHVDRKPKRLTVDEILAEIDRRIEAQNMWSGMTAMELRSLRNEIIGIDR